MEYGLKIGPKWSTFKERTVESRRVDFNRTRSGQLMPDNADEHFNRHLDNLNESKLNLEEEDPLSENEEANNTGQKTTHTHHEDNEDEEEEEPKLFHSEDVDLPCLVTSRLSPPSTSSHLTPLQLINQRSSQITQGKQITFPAPLINAPLSTNSTKPNVRT